MSPKARPATLGRLSFAVGPVRTMTDDEAEFQRSHTLQTQGGLEDILKVKESQVVSGTLIPL